MKTNKEILKKCYLACTEKNSNLNQTAKELNITIEEMIENAKEYYTLYCKPEEEKYQQCYVICQMYPNSAQALKIKAKEIGISPVELVNKARLYAMFYANIELVNPIDHEQVVLDILTKMQSATSKHEILQECLKTGLTKSEFLSVLRKIIHKFSLERDRLDIDKYRIIRKEIMQLFDKYVEKLPQDVFLITNSQAEILFEQYVNNDYPNRIDFCIENNIGIETFKTMLLRLKIYDEKLYNRVIKKESHDMDRKEITIRLKQIIEGLKNGIEENGQKRKYDVIDLYKSNLDLPSILDYARTFLNKTEQDIISFFMAGKNFEEDFGTKRKETLKKLEIKMLDPNTGQVLSSKNSYDVVMQYLKENNLPTNSMTFLAATRRYLSGFISVEQPIKRVRKEETVNED